MKEIQSLSPFKHLCMTIGNLPSSYVDSMSYYECLLWLCNYLEKTVIPAVNNNAEALEELQEYVKNYFDNLDVQEEINKKLDKMASDGSLITLIKSYIDPLYQSYENSINNTVAIQNNTINNQNTNIENITNKVNSLSSGSPAGVYESITALSTDNPDHSKIYLVTNDGGWYYWNTSTNSWTHGGTYQSVEFTKNSIKAYYDQIIIKKGLIPQENWITGKTIDQSGNVIDFSTGCYNSEYIPVESQTDYLLLITEPQQVSLRFNFYDSSYTYLSTNSKSISAASNAILTTPENTSYIRIASFSSKISEYPNNYAQLIKKSDLYNLIDYSKLSYLDFNYNLIDNKNVSIQNKIMFNPINYNGVANDSGITIKNKYTINYYKTLTTSAYTFYTIYVDTPVAGDKIRIKCSDYSHISSLGLYPYNSQSETTNFTYNASTDEYELTLTSDIVNNYFNNGIARIVPRVTKDISSSGTLVNFDMIVNINNLCNNFDDIIKLVSTIDEPKSYKALFLGDSITQLTDDRSWITYFKQIIPLSYINNVAVIGATLMDKENTEYDGNPTYDPTSETASANNVLGNQVQKIINNSSSYETPDFIMIAIGTNGGINITDESEIYSTYYNNDGSIKSLSNVDRKTSSGAFRYCNEKLHDLYPNAMIVWCTPIQGDNITRNVQNIITYSDNLKLLCSYGSNVCIDTEKCGILGINEISGTNGEDLADGLHPNAHGAKKMGTYNACEFKKFIDKINLNN